MKKRSLAAMPYLRPPIRESSPSTSGVSEAELMRYQHERRQEINAEKQRRENLLGPYVLQKKMDF